MEIIEKIKTNKLVENQTDIQKICLHKLQSSPLPNPKSELWRLSNKSKLSSFLDYSVNEKASKLGDKNFFKLPEPIINKAGCNLSFAGLKTAVLRESKKINGNDKLKFNLAASFQNTINKILYKKTKIAIEMFKKKINTSKY